MSIGQGRPFLREYDWTLSSCWSRNGRSPDRPIVLPSAL